MHLQVQVATRGRRTAPKSGHVYPGAVLSSFCRIQLLRKDGTVHIGLQLVIHLSLLRFSWHPQEGLSATKNTRSGWDRQNRAGGTHEVKCRFIGVSDLDEFSAVHGRDYLIEMPERVLLAHFHSLKPALV